MVRIQWQPISETPGNLPPKSAEAKHLVRDKAKCPFIPQREMEVKMNRVPEEVNELVYEDDWKPLEEAPTDTSLPLPRTWGRSTSRQQKFS